MALSLHVASEERRYSLGRDVEEEEPRAKALYNRKPRIVDHALSPPALRPRLALDHPLTNGLQDQPTKYLEIKFAQFMRSAEVVARDV